MLGQNIKIRKWSTQSRENAAWYQHEELGFCYRMSNIIAGVVRGQFPYLEAHAYAADLPDEPVHYKKRQRQGAQQRLY